MFPVRNNNKKREKDKKACAIASATGASRGGGGQANWDAPVISWESYTGLQVLQTSMIPLSVQHSAFGTCTLVSYKRAPAYTAKLGDICNLIVSRDIWGVIIRTEVSIGTVSLLSSTPPATAKKNKKAKDVSNFPCTCGMFLTTTRMP